MWMDLDGGWNKLDWGGWNWVEVGAWFSNTHFITWVVWDKYKVLEFDVSSVVMSLRSILSFLKKPVNNVNSGADNVVNIPKSSCTVVNSNVNDENVSPASNCFSLPEKPYHSSRDFVFPTAKSGSLNPRFWHRERFCSLFLFYEERIKTDSRIKLRTRKQSAY